MLDNVEIPLREKKYIRTKVALMNAFIERLKTTRIDDISIKEVCHSVEVSEGTFFNYFPRKIDLVYYFHQLFDYKVIWKTRQEVKSGRYLDLIDVLFQNIAKEFHHPFLIYELISIFTGEKKEIHKKEISLAEIAFALPDCPGIENHKESFELIKEFFFLNVKKAISHKELIFKTDPQDVTVAFVAIMVGTPLALEPNNFDKLTLEYKKHLNFLWKALGRLKGKK